MLQKKIIPLSLFQDPPVDLRRLLTNDESKEKKFRQNIRQYNAAFAFTLMGYNVDTYVTSCRGPKFFHVHGEIYHTQGPLKASFPKNAQYMQIFIYNLEMATEF